MCLDRVEHLIHGDSLDLLCFLCDFYEYVCVQVVVVVRHILLNVTQQE